MNQITGAEASRQVAGCEVRRTRGRDCYHPETRVIFLSEETWGGRDAACIYRALHEAGHAWQHRERALWFSLRNIWMFRLWIEWDAWKRAERWMIEMGLEPDERERVKGMGSYWGGLMTNYP